VVGVEVGVGVGGVVVVEGGVVVVSTMCDVGPLDEVVTAVDVGVVGPLDEVVGNVVTAVGVGVALVVFKHGIPVVAVLGSQSQHLGGGRETKRKDLPHMHVSALLIRTSSPLIQIYSTHLS
jgi:hypothetical protein